MKYVKTARLSNFFEHLSPSTEGPDHSNSEGILLRDARTLIQAICHTNLTYSKLCEFLLHNTDKCHPSGSRCSVSIRGQAQKSIRGGMFSLFRYFDHFIIYHSFKFKIARI